MINLSVISHKCCAQPSPLSTAFSFYMIILLRFADSTFSMKSTFVFCLGKIAFLCLASHNLIANLQYKTNREYSFYSFLTIISTSFGSSCRIVLADTTNLLFLAAAYNSSLGSKKKPTSFPFIEV